MSDGLCSIPVDHLALAVSDQDRSRRFYETYLGFGAEPSYRASDGTLFIFDAAGFSLALGVIGERIQLPPFLHFGMEFGHGLPHRAPREEYEQIDCQVAKHEQSNSAACEDACAKRHDTHHLR